MAAPLGADANPQTGKPTANHQNVRVDDFHGLVPWSESTWNQIRNSNFEIRNKPQTKKFQSRKIQNTGMKFVLSFGYFGHLRLFRISDFVLRILLFASVNKSEI